MDAVICLNKMDLVDAAQQEEHTAIFTNYEKLGYQVLYTSIYVPESLDAFREVLRDKFSVIIGASGVGKSSLLNAIQPNLGLRTAEVGIKTQKGRHTTTLVELFALAIGGEVADTPGIREVGLWGIDTENLEVLFPRNGTLPRHLQIQRLCPCRGTRLCCPRCCRNRRNTSRTLSELCRVANR